MQAIKKWYRRRRFLKAYRILRNEFEHHRDADHEILFVAVNESHVMMVCKHCPNLQP